MESEGSECLTISVDAAAKWLGISRGLAYEMVRQGKIPALRFGRVIRVPRHALEQLLDNQGTAGKADKSECRYKQGSPSGSAVAKHGALGKSRIC